MVRFEEDPILIDCDYAPFDRGDEKCIRCNATWANHRNWACPTAGGDKAPALGRGHKSKTPPEFQFLTPSMIQESKMPTTLKDAKLDDQVIVYLTPDGYLSETKTDRPAHAIVIGVGGIDSPGNVQLGFIGNEKLVNAIDGGPNRLYGAFKSYSKQADKYPYRSISGESECVIGAPLVKTLKDCKMGDKVRLFVDAKGHLATAKCAAETVEVIVASDSSRPPSDDDDDGVLVYGEREVRASMYGAYQIGNDYVMKCWPSTECQDARLPELKIEPPKIEEPTLASTNIGDRVKVYLDFDRHPTSKALADETKGMLEATVFGKTTNDEVILAWKKGEKEPCCTTSSDLSLPRLTGDQLNAADYSSGWALKNKLECQFVSRALKPEIKEESKPEPKTQANVEAPKRTIAFKAGDKAQVFVSTESSTIGRVIANPSSSDLGFWVDATVVCTGCKLEDKNTILVGWKDGEIRPMKISTIDMDCDDRKILPYTDVVDNYTDYRCREVMKAYDNIHLIRQEEAALIKPSQPPPAKEAKTEEVAVETSETASAIGPIAMMAGALIGAMLSAGTKQPVRVAEEASIETETIEELKEMVNE